MREKRESLRRSPSPPRTTLALLEGESALEAKAEGLSQRGLGKRLGLSDVAIAKAKKTKDEFGFAAWTKVKDPDRIAWEYRDGKYYPMK